MAIVHPLRSRALIAFLPLVLALALAGCGGGSANPTAEAVAVLGPGDAQALVESGDVEVLDVRTPEEYAQGHIEGATLVDFYEPDFAERIGRLDRDREYVVYCRSGNRSAQATALMAEQGFTAVNDIEGGILAWEAAGLPVAG